jgi:hypothetical protein
MSTKASYTVTITFNKAHKECAIGLFKSSYLFGKNNQDDFKFDSSKITIELKRSKSYADCTILSNDMNSINRQIKKAIVIYYALAKKFPHINEVSIVRNYKRKQNLIYTDANNIIQPIELNKNSRNKNSRNKNSRNKNVKLAIDPACASSLINEDSKGFALRTALTYWLCGQAVDNDYLKFDKYWRAFDRLILYNGNTTKEKDGICEMKKLIISNPDSFPKSSTYVKSLTSQQIRNLDWIKLLLSKKQRISDILKEYSDARICNMFSQIINDKRIKTILQSKNELSNVNTHFQSNLNTINDIEYMTLIALTYVYYLSFASSTC